MIGLVRRIHHVTLGTDRPLSVHSRKESGVAALDRAIDGTLLLDAESLPADLPLVLASRRSPSTRVRLVIAAPTPKLAVLLSPKVPNLSTLSIPPLTEREQELDRICSSTRTTQW